MSLEFQTIKLENDGPVWWLSVHRPEALNALNSQVLSEMGEALRMVGELPFESARVLVITGSGEKSFVAGADIKEIAALSEDEAVGFAHRGQNAFHELNLMKIPVIAAVNGFALGGGCELALACDFIVAAENAKFGLPEVSLGLIPGFGGTVRLSRAVGARRARELIYTGDMIPAAEAHRLGLVNHVVPAAELRPAVKALAEKILGRAPAAVGMAKKSINRTWDMDIEEGQRFEAESFAELFATQDVREGTAAFIEKRKAQFKGE
ncbi:MAG: enoyl-CoA hydratase/isomerase family protein [Bdellovibrionaceae bacterium]|nr:enoyl-CoA hydratase/isomerase family protein [Pseudobdellovibrionaceae bacterium]MBX3034749.1 enoyl-CoA hydratase/isomerase family protein [Pseudobdellovibrionaceae bacterium]